MPHRLGVGESCLCAALLGLDWKKKRLLGGCDADFGFPAMANFLRRAGFLTDAEASWIRRRPRDWERNGSHWSNYGVQRGVL